MHAGTSGKGIDDSEAMSEASGLAAPRVFRAAFWLCLARLLRRRLWTVLGVPFLRFRISAKPLYWCVRGRLLSRRRKLNMQMRRSESAEYGIGSEQNSATTRHCRMNKSALYWFGSRQITSMHQVPSTVPNVEYYLNP